MSATPAGEWKRANRKEITLPSGRVVVIRKLTGEFILLLRDVFEPYLTAGDAAADLRLPLETQRKYFATLVCEGVVSPKVVPAGREPGENEVNPADFGEDLDALIGEISEFNAGMVRGPFRPAKDSDAAPPGGEGVRPAAVEPAAGGVGGPAA